MTLSKMKLIAVIIVGVFAMASAIRVPISWPKEQNVDHSRHKFRTIPSGQISEIGPQSKPHGVQINIERKYQPYNSARHPNLKSEHNKDVFKASASNNEWTPIFPPFMTNSDDPFFKNFKPSPIQKNYRDDDTHEPHQETDDVEEPVRDEKPISVHEVPSYVPTKPIYPGAGQWAKRGKMHRPFISKHQFSKLAEEDDERKPDGYDVFERNQQLFTKKREEFPSVTEEDDENAAGEEDDEDEEEEQQFVPTRLYAQVRRSENMEHLPGLIEDPRLKEVIKDSKIQTVYTEEGYEDIAYDHAGHEKKAEESEGFAEFDKEIEKEKQKQKQVKYIDKDDDEEEEEEAEEEDSEASGSYYHVINKPFKMRKDNFMKTQETKISSIKDKESGTPELEVLSEVKILPTPNNKTKTHKYIKIAPKGYRYDINTVPPHRSKELMTAESFVVKTLYERKQSKRIKRFTNDFPKIEVDTDFIDKIKHNLPQVVQKFEKPKYPYYNDPSLHPNSPLRYAEDLDNIPKKTEDEMAFYNQAEKIQCPEIPTNVDPVPRRIKNADADPENVEDTTDIQELVKSPRLTNLGDKIDCLKVKYFGENPLDSPIFQEETVGPVLPIFNIFKPHHKTVAESKNDQVISQEDRKKSEEFGFNVLQDVISQLNAPPDIKAEATSHDATTTEVNEARIEEYPTENAVVSIITTPKYTIDLKPKHIYHQIELLEYLPEVEDATEVVINNSTEEQQNRREGKSMEEESTTAAAAVSEETSPESQPLRNRKRRVRPKHPYYHIFDVNRFIPTSSYPFLNQYMKTSTVVPKHDYSSTVQYRHEIAPSEQFIVFADVINNIKNSSRDPLQMAASSTKISAKYNLFDRYPKIPFIKSINDLETTDSFYLPTTTTTTTTPSPRGTVKFSSYKDKLYTSEDSSKYENLELLKVKRKTKSTTTTTEPYFTDSTDAASNEESTIVLGLVPPIPVTSYKTIYKPIIINEETKMNNFYVLGMKPPSPKQKVYLYSDYKVRPNNKIKYPFLRRGKREAQRPSYSGVVRNRNKPIDVEDDTEVVVEDDDDYVPHRPRNYHYDEKTGRIVYENVQKGEEEPEEEYIEVTEAPLPKPTRRNLVTTPKFENFTGPSYIDFISQLKSNPKYQAIPDPTTTEKNEEETTTTTTTKPLSTTPPEFLSILAKVRSDSNYKAITDKTTTKRTTTTTVEPEEEETQLENVQNAPGGQSSGQNFQIFDISEYLPKVKNYTPRTSIDYSKYKTIERPNVSTRHNLSSRYNAEEEDIEEVKTNKGPVLMEEQKRVLEETEINPIVSESKHEDVEPSTSTMTEEPSTTTTKRTRTRNNNNRGTRRPSPRTTTTLSSSDIESESESPSVRHDKPRRTYPRRQRTRIKFNKTTTENADSALEETIGTKIIRRKHEVETESPGPIIEDRIYTVPTAKTYQIVTPKSSDNLEKNVTKIEPRKLDHVQVFQQIDETKKHGGNYKKENVEEESKKVHEVKRLSDVVPKPSAFYTDPKLPKNVNGLKEVEETEAEIEETEAEIEDAEEGTEDEEAFDYEVAPEKTTTTKKPVFIKDPNKRMYYYAPI